MLFPWLQPNRGIMRRGLQSPLQEELTDSDFKKVWLNYPFVPFLDSGDATLRVLRNLSELSPTKAGVMKSKIGYATAEGIDLIKTKDALIKRQRGGEEVISDMAHDDYIDFLKSNMDVDKLNDSINMSMKSYETFGNEIVEFVLVETAGVRGGAINPVQTEWFRYMQPDRKIAGQQWAYLSPRWTFEYTSEFPPTEYPMYPNWKQFPDGTYRCLYHNKEAAENRSWYGLPGDFACIYSQYSEYQSGKFTTRSYENQFLPSVIMEMYGIPESTDEKKFKAWETMMYDDVSNVFTNRRDGAKPPLMILRGGTTSNGDPLKSNITQLSPNTGEGFHEAMKAINQAQILKCNEWHSSLIEKSTGSLGNDSAFTQIAMQVDATVIKPLQNKTLRPYREFLKVLETWVGYQNTEGITIGLRSVFEAFETKASEAAAKKLAPIPTIPQPATI